MKKIQDIVEYAYDFTSRHCTTRKKHCSLIFDGSDLKQIACNGFEVPSRYAHMRYRSLHSEVAALMRCNIKKMKNPILYNFRFNNQGIMKMAKPCKICMPWCESVFDAIYYSNEDGTVVRLENIYE